MKAFIVFGLLALMLAVGVNCTVNAFADVAEQRAECSAKLQATYPKMGAKYADRFCENGSPHYSMGN